MLSLVGGSCTGLQQALLALSRLQGMYNSSGEPHQASCLSKQGPAAVCDVPCSMPRSCAPIQSNAERHSAPTHWGAQRGQPPA